MLAHLWRRARRLVRDERGGELIEYALVAGLIIIATLAAVGGVGVKVLARWNTVNAASL